MAWSIDWACPCPRDEVGSFPGRKVSRRFSWSRCTSPRSRATTQLDLEDAAYIYPLKLQTNRYWCSIREKNEEYSEEIVFRNQYETSKEMFLEHSNIRAFNERSISINDTFERCCETDFFIVLIRITKRESDSWLKTFPLVTNYSIYIYGFFFFFDIYPNICCLIF